MQLGAPTSVRSCWPGHENSDRYEPVAELGNGAERSRYLGCSLVRGRSSQHFGPSHYGLSGCGKRLYFAKNPQIGPSVAKANADLIDFIGMAKAMPLQN